MSSWERTVSHADKYHCFGKSSFWRTYVLKLLRSARFIKLDESESSAANEKLTTMNSSGAEIAGKTGKQPRNIFCLNDQANIACFMCLRGV